MTTIYLSSTYEDLKDYRRAVFEALRHAGYEVKAMEDYVATDRRPVEKCLADVARADIYVGLFAFRYGYVPPAEHGNPDGLSITELEFWHAEKLKKPCLAFLVSEDAPWPAEFIDRVEGDRISRLREYLLTEKTASFFSSPYQLASLVQAAVTNHLERSKKAKTQGNKETEPSISDIFISYKREDQATARALANALEKEGWSVWWDPKLRAGDHFDDVIEKALNAAKCVIVIWSERSVQSRYVRDEATYALDRDKLVPVAIEKVNLPFRFRGVHTPSLLNWDGSTDSLDFRKLIDDISSILGPPPGLPSEGTRLSQEERLREPEPQRSADQAKPKADEQTSRQTVNKPNQTPDGRMFGWRVFLARTARAAAFCGVLGLGLFASYIITEKGLSSLNASLTNQLDSQVAAASPAWDRK